MSRLVGLSYCLALALLTGSAMSLVSTDTISFDIFLSNMTFSDKNDLQHNTSQVYGEMIAKVNEYLSPAGGESETIVISDGGGCVKINIAWRNVNQTVLAEIMDRFQKYGFTIWGQTWTISLTGCGEATLLRFRLYVVNMPWSDNYTDQSSMEYQQMMQIVTDYFSTLGGTIHALEMAKISDCLELYVEWDALNSSNIIDLTADLLTNGITVNNQKFSVQTYPCQDETMLLRFKFYAVNLKWSESFKNHNSDEYQKLLQDVKNTFTDLGGSMQALEIADKFGCVEFYVEWNVQNLTIIIDLTSSIVTHGVILMGQNYTVQLNACMDPSAETTILRFKFYVLKMPWSENFKNHSSSEYQDLLQDVKYALINMPGNIQALEIAEISGCNEFYVEFETINSTNIINLMSTLTTMGIMINNEMYTVLSKPCTAEISVLKFTFYVVNMSLSDNYTDHNSLEFLQIMQDIQSIFSNLGGTIRALEIAKNYGCLQFYLEWDALYITNIIDLYSILDKNGITFMSQTYAVQNKPCEIPPADIDNCPELPEGTIGTCIDGCNDNALGRNCSEGFKCCSNGCGRTCQRVGYAVKINTAIVIELNWMESMDNKSSSVFLELKMAAKTMVTRNFNVDNLLFADVELTKISKHNVNGQSLSLLDIVIYLVEDISNEQLETGRSLLLRDSYSITNDNFRVIDVYLGGNSASSMPICGGVECYGICKELHSSIQYCSCNLGYVGSDCATFECRTETNNSLCQNGGECAMKLLGIDFECRCKEGFIGPLCQVDLNSCPLVPARRSDLMGLCQSTCFGRDCNKEELCCEVPCGGNACVEVGYFQKMLVTATTDFPYVPGLNDTSSIESQILIPQIMAWFNSLMQQNSVDGFKSVKVVNLKPSTNEQVSRRKRGYPDTVIVLELKFTNAIPVKKILLMRDKVLATGYSDNQFSFTIKNLTLGSEGDCPIIACAKDSFCVTNYGGEVQCACLESKTGQQCENTNCNPHGTDLCQHGGKCSNSNGDMQMICDCPAGFSGELCEELQDVCAMGLCINGGTCHNLLGGKYKCECPEGFSGTSCQDAANHCRNGQPMMTTLGEQQCPRRTCPMGFICNADPLDRWTACCFKEDFMCDVNPCKAGGECVSDFNLGSVCRCANGTQGLFCEQASNDTVALTACQKKQLFSDWMINILETGITTLGITLEDMRVILQHLGYKYISTDICDAQGNFKSIAKGVLVVSPNVDRVMICLDKSGNFDPECGAAVCDVLSNNGSLQFCQNGGRCLGEITQQLCNCSGTGYHGIRCELIGEDVNETSCTLRQDISNLAIEILNGSVNLIPGLNSETTKNATKEILKIYYNAKDIFVPYCDDKGQYEYRGCLYMVDDLLKKNCYCALESGEIVTGSKENPLEPPPNCRADPNSCPEVWGKNCEQPDWWCSETLQCQIGSERCAYFTECANDVCTQVEVECGAKINALPCDLQPCKDDPYSMCQPCGPHGTCYNVGRSKSADLGYRCMCNTGYSGYQCEINENVCSLIPKGLCKSHCIGDISQGKLCQCDPGYGGIFCSKPARSLCERRKALYDDVYGILNGGINQCNCNYTSDMKTFVALIVQEEGANQIPVLNCTDNGFYYKVQCMVSSDLVDKKCYCVEFNGEPLSSNVKPYIGYDVCTAPSDPFELAQTACSASSFINTEELTVCLNGGTCIFEMYGGKFCSCPVGYHGQFCQYQGNVSGVAESKSLCNFFADLWDIANEISTGRANWITSDLQKQLFLNLSLNFLQLQNNESSALKAECQDDGTFKPAACYYNIMTGEKESCHCWDLKGMIIEGSPVESADTDKCTDIADSTCPKLKCLYICEHGYRADNTGCQTCDCRNPCEDRTCDLGERCVIENLLSFKKIAMQMTYTKAVCMPADKPGACPMYSPKLYSEGLLAAASNSSSCNVTCYDDTDCEGKKKCCGLCGNTCIDPEVTYFCGDYQMKMKAQLEFIQMALDELEISRETDDVKMLKRLTDNKYIWIPSCTADGIHFNPLQCQHTVNNSGALGNVSSCFCVDFLGNKIEGAKANLSDPTSCNVKPFTCPFVEPVQISDKALTCQKDFDCVQGQKCCASLGNQVCQTPVDTSKLRTTLDLIMSTLCEENANMCQGGSRCVKTWMEAGIACECPVNRVGPFCEQLINGTVDVPRTPCERKSFAVKVFTEQLGGTNNSWSFVKLLNSVTDNDVHDMQVSIISKIWYQCMADGTFEPKQCIVNAYDQNGESPIECFCVYENGTEILGTRTTAKNGNPLFCGENSKTCPSGNASRDDNGIVIECRDKDVCPMGYACSRSIYGRLLCCPTDEGLKQICKQPKDDGMRCLSDATGMQSGNFYYYDEMEGACKNFTYNGCEGNVNRFSTFQKCNDMCNLNIHPGTCPINPVKVAARATCLDQCNADNDCDQNYKCCSSTCGKKCIPGNGGSICPIGFPKEAINGGNCNSTNLCGMGAICISTEMNPGVCCPDYNVDQCLIPPGIQSCQKFEQHYFYNATSKMCQTTSYTGCDPEFNSFKSFEECCGACGEEGHCKKGICPSVKSGSVSTCTSECLNNGDCSGEMICCSNGCGTTCVVPDFSTAEMSDCMSQQMEALKSKNVKNDETNCSTCDVTNIPVCNVDGTWASQQCQTNLGICWCVSPQGNYIENTITRGIAKCDGVSQLDIMRADQNQVDVSQLNYPVCENGEDFYCCSKALCAQTCFAYSDAVCLINPCGGCKAEFYTADGMMIDCNEGKSLCEKDLMQATTVSQEHQINEALASGDNIDSIYDSKYRKSSGFAERRRSLSSDYPARCQLLPETGPCKGFQTQWYFDSGSEKCNMFIWGMCKGNDNRFDSPEECYTSCSPRSNPCLNTNCTATSTMCKLQYDEDCYLSEMGCNLTTVCTAAEPEPYMVKDLFMPSCMTSGQFNYKQCHGKYCWCVDKNGQYVNGLTVEQASSLMCSENGTSQVISPGDGICPSGHQPNITCMKACMSQVCPGQPEAVCVANLCSSSCSTKFVDNNGQEVMCTGDICKVFTFDKSDHCNNTVPCQGNSVKACSESVCVMAMQKNCSKNPCAVCKVDINTCQPYFVDVTMGNRLTENQCQYLSVGICKVKKCNIINDIEKAKFRNIDLGNTVINTPDCEDNGMFKPKQCQDKNCHCVNQFGLAADKNSDGSCKKIDKIKIVKITFTFNADFATFKKSNKLRTLVAMLLEKLLEVGINPQLIKSTGEPYEGSIKVDVTIENGAGSYDIDLAQILFELEQKAKTGALNLTIDGQPVPLTNITKDVQTESQDAGENKSHVNNDGLTETEKIIIGVVCGCVGLLIIAIIAYCLCCRKRKQKEPIDDSFEAVRDSPMPFGKPALLYSNQNYSPYDTTLVKVKL